MLIYEQRATVLPPVLFQYLLTDGQEIVHLIAKVQRVGHSVQRNLSNTKTTRCKLTTARCTDSCTRKKQRKTKVQCMPMYNGVQRSRAG